MNELVRTTVHNRCPRYLSAYISIALDEPFTSKLFFNQPAVGVIIFATRANNPPRFMQAPIINIPLALTRHATLVVRGLTTLFSSFRSLMFLQSTQQGKGFSGQLDSDLIKHKE